MIEALIAEIFKKTEHEWMIGGELRIPDEEDVTIALDQVASELHKCKVGDRLDMGGLIVDKTYTGHDVYVFVGSYQ